MPRGLPTSGPGAKRRPFLQSDSPGRVLGRGPARSRWPEPRNPPPGPRPPEEEEPWARHAATAAERVHPVPWVWGVSSRARRQVSSRTPSQKRSTTSPFSRCPPLTRAAPAPISTRALAAAAHIVQVVDGKVGQDPGLVKVGGDQSGKREELGHEGGLGLPGQEPVAAGGTP